MEFYPNKYGLKSETGTGEVVGQGQYLKEKIREREGLFEKLMERLELVYILMTGGDINRVHGKVSFSYAYAQIYEDIIKDMLL